MEKRTVTKTQFNKLLKTIGDETYQIVSEGSDWYEQLTDGEMVYQYKLMSSEELEFDDFWKKAIISDKLMSEGKVYAYGYVKDKTIKYYLVPSKKLLEHEYNKARNMIMNYARWLAEKQSSRPPRVTEADGEEASK